MQKIKKDDIVIVIAGKDKDKTGKVLSVKDGKVIVEGVNVCKKLQIFKHGKIWCNGSFLRRYVDNLFNFI